MLLFGVDLQVVGVQVRLVFVCRFVSSVAVFDHWVQQVFEHLVGLLVSGHAAHRHDERVTCGDTKWPTVSVSPVSPREHHTCVWCVGSFLVV